MSTHSKGSDPGAQILGSKYLFGEICRFKTLRAGLNNLLTADAKAVVMSEDQKAQSHAGAPVTLIKDLTREHGQQISVDIGHELTEPPIMGDNVVEGKEEPLTRASFKLSIDQHRKPVAMGGAMNQQRLGYSMLKVGNQAITNYWNRMNSEMMLYHLAGARGDFNDVDIIYPLAGDNLNQYMVNPLTAPTFRRTFYAGDAQSIDGTVGNAMTAGDQLDRTTIENLSFQLQEMAHPPQAIDLSTEDTPMQTDPFYLLLVTPRAWTRLRENSTAFETLVAQATRRAAGFNHHLFRGDCLMIENILVRKYHVPVTFNPASLVSVSDDNKSASVHNETVPAGVQIDRSLLLGAQAIAQAYGSQKPGRSFNLVTQKYDADNKTRGVLEAMMGSAKVRFEDKNGRMEDYGCCVLDSAVPLR